jgi:flavin reductase (DIM6/NTAB) family NADH-FMN oxidoreductase RutF
VTARARADAVDPAPDVRAAARAAFRQFVWPVTALTYEDGGRVSGMTISSVTSLSLDPPAVVLCIDRHARTHERVAVGAVLGLSVMALGQVDLAELLSSRGADKSLQSERVFRPFAEGVPVLVGAAAAFAIQVHRMTPAFSHSVVVGTIRAVHLPSPMVAPLGYHDGSYVAIARIVPVGPE